MTDSPPQQDRALSRQSPDKLRRDKNSGGYRRERMQIGDFGAFPVERYQNIDRGCPAPKRALLVVFVGAILKCFWGRTQKEAGAAANRFLLAELKREARRARATDARREGRKRQAAQKRNKSDG